MLVEKLERKMIFFPVSDQESWETIPSNSEDIWIQHDDVNIHGWHLKNSAAQHLLIYFHGNAGNLAGRKEIVELLRRELNVAVLIFDYREYGKSSGSMTTRGGVRDSLKVFQYATRVLRYQPEQIILLGRSLGGGMAVQVAKEHNVRALILESTFTSLTDMAGLVLPWFPAKTLMTEALDSASITKDLRMPLFHSHGKADEVIPFAMGKALHDSAGNQPKTFVELPGLDHNTRAGADYWASMKAFLGALP